MKTDDGFFLAKMMSKSFITTFISINYTFLSKIVHILMLGDRFCLSICKFEQDR